MSFSKGKQKRPIIIFNPFFVYCRFPLTCIVPLICYTLVTFDTTCLIAIHIKYLLSYSAKRILCISVIHYKWEFT